MRRKVMLVIVAIIIGSAFTTMNFSDTSQLSQRFENVLKVKPHDVIRINSNTDFANQAADEGWLGNGTESNPYIISGYDIDAHGAGDAIYIGNTTVYFIVENCYLHNASHHSWPYFGGAGITLHNVTNSYVFNNTILDNERQGIRFRYASNSMADSNIINGTHRGFAVEYSNNITIMNNLVENIYITSSSATFAMRFHYTENCLVYNNTVKNSEEYGISLYSSNKNRIIQNNISDVEYDGIYFEYDNNNNLIEGNTISNNKGSGISIGDSSDNNVIKNNTISSNERNGIYVYYSNSNIMDSNTVCSNEADGIFFHFSKNNIVKNDLIYNNSGYGICIYSSGNNELYSNKMKNDGIYLLGDKSTFTTQTIAKNTTVNGKPVYYYNNVNMNNATVPLNAGEVILGNVTWLKIENLNLLDADIGIILAYSSYINIVNNRIYNNNWSGIELYLSSNNIVNNNTIYNNTLSGIWLSFSSNNTIVNNSIHNNSIHGILLLDSSINIIKENIISYNKEYGVYIIGNSNHNLIYDNFFYYNHGSTDTFNATHVQASDGGINNFWNSSGGIGNYWQDWANNNDTNDQNHDGIVDHPYKINGPAESKDYYPLKNPSVPAQKSSCNCFMAILAIIIVIIAAIVITFFVVIMRRKK